MKTDPTSNHGAPPGRRLTPRPAIVSGAVVVLVFGLLLWARFLLVTGHPRTALADPSATRAPSPAAGGSVAAAAGEH